MALKEKGSYGVFVENVEHGYGGKPVLNNVDLAISKGEFFSLVGPSGCGKSTLLRLLLGAEQPNKGTVLIEGRPIVRPGFDCGIVYQKYSVFPHMTVLENVAIGPMITTTRIYERAFRLDGAKRKKALNEACQLLKIVGLEEAADKYPCQLSGGMQQRVAIAQALIMRPKVLLLDEPFSALDPWTREQLQIFLINLWKERGMTVFFVTHDLEEAVYLGTRIAVLAQYYRTGLGVGKGSRIIADLAVPTPHPRPLEFKASDTLNGIVSRIRKFAFAQQSEERYFHIKDLTLEHPDSFHTAPETEWKR